MEGETLGEVIRSLRKRMHLTQEELAEGICSPISISRIENGTQMPSSQVLDALLARLGTSTYQICNIYYKSEKQIAFEKQADEVAVLIRDGQLERAKKCMASLEKHVGENALNQQYYMLLLASLQIGDSEKTDEVIDLLKQSLEITKPQFSYHDFRRKLLTAREANILSLLLIAYYKKQDILEAIQLGEELSESLQQNVSKIKDYSIIRVNVALNLAQCLSIENRYREALRYCSDAEELSYKLSEHALLPEILCIKAKLLYHLGEREECERIMRGIIPYMELIHKKDMAEAFRNYATNTLGITLELNK